MNILAGSLTLRRVAVALFLLTLSAAPTFAAEVIQSLDSDVHVAKDGELTVSETIRVNAENGEIRHGIYRDFPLTFRDADGSVREVTFSLLGVSRDGKPERHFTKHIGNAIRIYAGDKDTVVSPGEHTYIFRYRTGRQLRWFGGKPELNWNATGNFWIFPILAATYHLHLIDHMRPLRFTAYTGRMGARGRDWQGAIGDDGVLRVSTTRRLAPHEGLTVVAALPDGAVAPPSAATRLWWSFLDNRRWIFGGLGFVLVLGYYLAAWKAVGRDPKAGTIIPLFHPPPGISPALANYIHRWGFGREKWRAFTAAALSLAVRGLVRFNQSGKTLTLKAAGKKPAGGIQGLPPGERAIYSWVNEMGAATIDKAHGERVAKVGDAFTKNIEAESRNRFFRRNLGYAIAGLAMTVVVIIGVVAFGGLGDTDLGIVFGIAFASVWLGVFLVPFLSAMFGSARFHSVVRSAMTLIVVVIFVSIALNIVRGIFPHGLGEAVPVVGSALAAYPFPFVFVASFAALNGLFFYLLRAPTALGRPVMDQLEGFKLYLETAEAERLNYKAPEITAERFEALLPYAVALDVEKPWAAAFAAALARAHPDETDPMHHYQPAWYGGGAWSGSDFSSAVGASVAGAAAALTSAVPVSSGSSGFSRRRRRLRRRWRRWWRRRLVRLTRQRSRDCARLREFWTRERPCRKESPGPRRSHPSSGRRAGRSFRCLRRSPSSQDPSPAR